MKWTSWWARRAANGDIELVEATMLGKELVVLWLGSEEYESLDTFDLWAGPLEPPPLPINHGACPVCGKDVIGDDYSHTNATEHANRMLHNECADRHCGKR